MTWNLPKVVQSNVRRSQLIHCGGSYRGEVIILLDKCAVNHTHGLRNLPHGTQSHLQSMRILPSCLLTMRRQIVSKPCCVVNENKRRILTFLSPEYPIARLPRMERHALLPKPVSVKRSNCHVALRTVYNCAYLLSTIFSQRTFRQIADLALYSLRLVCAFTGRRETFLDILVLDFTVTLHSLFLNEESRAGGSYNSSCYSSYNCHCIQQSVVLSNGYVVPFHNKGY